MILRSRPRSSESAMPSVNAFYSWVVTGIENAARAHRMNLLYATLPVDDNNQALDIPGHLLDQSLAGLLLVGAFSAETVAELVSSRATPAVAVDGPATPSQHDAVVSDNERGAAAAVRYLISQGHRHIALLGPEPRVDPNFNQRRDGYMQVLREHALAEYSIEIDQRGTGTVADAIAPVLDRNPQITALFACNDWFAIEAIRALETERHRVPDDVSVVGFDDIALAEQIRPQLTTMAVDKITMGRLAVLLLNQRLAWPDATPALAMLQPSLRIRASVRTVGDVAKPLDTGC